MALLIELWIELDISEPPYCLGSAPCQAFFLKASNALPERSEHNGDFSCKSSLKNKFKVVPEVGLEPTRDRSHQILSLARLPVSPLRHVGNVASILLHILDISIAESKIYSIFSLDWRIVMIKKMFGLVSICLLLSSCQSLPDGRAPRGPIVDSPQAVDVYSVRAAENRMATVLSTELLKMFTPGSTVLIRLDFLSDIESADVLPYRVLQNIRDLYPFAFAEASPYSLESRIGRVEDGVELLKWEMRLFRQSELLWSCRLIIDMAADAGK